MTHASARVTKGGLERRIQRAAFGLSMLLALSLGLVILLAETYQAQRQQASHQHATLSILLNTLSSRLDRQVDILDQLSDSALLWTAISDSVGRDAYLTPFLANLNETHHPFMRVTLFDYRGRWITGAHASSEGLADSQHLIEETIAHAQARSSRVMGEHPRLLLAFPVRYPYTDDVIGVLLGEIDLNEVMQRQLAGLGEDLGYRIDWDAQQLFASHTLADTRYLETAAEFTHAQFPQLYRFRVALFVTQAPWLTQLIRVGGVYMAVAALLTMLVWFLSGLLAKRLVERLNRLSDVVSGKELPRAEDIPRDGEADEISRLAETLRAALSAHAQITAHLEDLVETRTQDLTRSQERFKLALDGSRDGIWDWDITGGQTYLSSRWKSMIGYASDELENSFQTFHDHLHPDDRDRVLDTLHRYLNGEEAVYEVAFRFRCKNGGWRHVLARGAALRDECGKPIRMAGSHTDITERKELEALRDEALERLQKIADRVPGLVYQYRSWPDGRACFPFASKAIQQIFRVSPEAVATDAERVFQRIHPDDLANVLASLQESAQMLIPWSLEYRVRFGDGSVRWLMGNAIPERQADASTLWHGFIADVTDRRRSDEVLRKLSTVVEQSPVSVLMTNLEGRIEYVNPEFSRITGYSWEEVIGATPRILKSERTPPEVYQELWGALTSGRAWRGELCNRRKNGEHYWEETHIAPVVDAAGAVTHFVSLKIDISARKRDEEKLRLAASVFTHAREGILITDAQGIIEDINATFTRLTGYAREEVLGKRPRLLSSGQQDAAFYAAMWRDLTEQGDWQGELWNRHKNGTVFAEQLTIGAVRDEQGITRHYVGLFSDITEQKQYQARIEHIAHFDALTGLPNRVLLADRLHQGMAQTLRHERLLAVAYLDLDGFKAINDAHGHEAGDQLLLGVAKRMRQAVRDEDTVARLGGDEFVAVFHDLYDIEASVPLLLRLLEAASRPVQVHALSLQVSASIGVTFYPQQEVVDADQLLRQADQAMYQAKLAGKNRYHVFDAEQDRSVRGHHESLEHIQRALGQGEFILHYQPKVNMRSGQILGVEALIRWRHPERGLLPPAHFLPVIEDHALAIELGEWVIETALSELETWQAQGLQLQVSVNMGARQLQQSNFCLRLRESLSRHPRMKPEQLELEVLESNALEDLAHISQVIETCHAMGVHFALDDFGTGYSSLSYLKRLPARMLKIDQSFVRDMLDDPDDLAILDGILGLATAFRRQALAEGVETLEHGVLLLQLGCELAQGYAIARPMPADAVPAWVAAWRSVPEWLNRTPFAREDLPILYAAVEHRAWFSAIARSINGESSNQPVMDQHQCRFGQWLDTSGRKKYAGNAALKVIEDLHLTMHAQAKTLFDLMKQGHTGEARSRLVALRVSRDNLLRELLELSR